MRYWFIIFFGLQFGAFAQDSTSSGTIKTRRFALGAFVSPDLCFRTLVNQDRSALSNDVYDMDQSIDQPKMGFTGGLCFRVAFCKHLEFETALAYSNKGFKTKESDLTFGDLIDRRRGFVYSTTGLPAHGKLVYTFHYIDIPLKINYVAGNKKIRFVCGAGIALNFLLTETTVFKGTDPNGNATTRRSTDNSYNRINISPCVSAGLNWQLTSRTDLRIEPSFRYGIIKIIDGPVTAYLWNAGLNVSYSLKL